MISRVRYRFFLRESIDGRVSFDKKFAGYPKEVT
jgi:hypothetical protein